MRLPNGKEVSGRWLLIIVLVMACLISFLPHAADLQYNGKP